MCGVARASSRDHACPVSGPAQEGLSWEQILLHLPALREGPVGLLGGGSARPRTECRIPEPSSVLCTGRPLVTWSQRGPYPLPQSSLDNQICRVTPHRCRSPGPATHSLCRRWPPGLLLQTERLRQPGTRRCALVSREKVAAYSTEKAGEVRKVRGLQTAPKRVISLSQDRKQPWDL